MSNQLKVLASALKKFCPEAVELILNKVADHDKAYEEFMAFLMSVPDYKPERASCELPSAERASTQSGEPVCYFGVPATGAAGAEAGASAASPLHATCMICGNPFGEPHVCIEVSELEGYLAGLLAQVETCDHYCCRMSHFLCGARTLLKQLKCDAVYQLTAADRPTVPAAEWYPIETAPKTGTHILAADFSGHGVGFGGNTQQSYQCVVHWWQWSDGTHQDEWGWYPSTGAGEQGALTNLTHWQPLHELTTS